MTASYENVAQNIRIRNKLICIAHSRTDNPTHCMKSAAVVNFAPEPGSVELQELEPPTIGDEDVLLEVANVGVCGSDLHQWTADHSWPVNYPVVLGHEFGGTSPKSAFG